MEAVVSGAPVKIIDLKVEHMGSGQARTTGMEREGNNEN